MVSWGIRLDGTNVKVYLDGVEVASAKCQQKHPTQMLMLI